MKEDTDLFVIDEVGKMELFSSLFFPAVLRVLDSNKPFIATIPVPKAGRDIPAGILTSYCTFVNTFLNYLIALAPIYLLRFHLGKHD